jgi:hypothetical protein
MEKPMFKHDCDKCKFLGTYKRRDLYVCDTDLVARFGDGGDEYESGLFLIYDNPWINKAMKLAEEKGLVGAELRVRMDAYTLQKISSLGILDRKRNFEESKLILEGYLMCLSNNSDVEWAEFVKNTYAEVSAELNSLKTMLAESSLKEYFPARNASLHDKVLFAIAKMTEIINSKQ